MKRGDRKGKHVLIQKNISKLKNKCKPYQIKSTANHDLENDNEYRKGSFYVQVLTLELWLNQQKYDD